MFVPAPVVRRADRTPNESLACDNSSCTEAMNHPAYCILSQERLVRGTNPLRGFRLYLIYICSSAAVFKRSVSSTISNSVGSVTVGRGASSWQDSCSCDGSFRVASTRYER